MLLVPGGADTALASAVTFYAANGFTSEGIAQLRRGNYRIVMVAMNRDHSAAETNLTIALIRG
jgi:RNase P/RNase MRP subunit POP5